MIKLRNPRVTGFERDSNDVYWEIEPTTLDVQEYEFYVERSEAEAGPFIEIAGPLIDRYYLRDVDFPPITLNRTLFYRIKVRHPLSGRVEYSKVFDRQGEPDLIADEIVRLETLLFQEFAGTVCWLFPRRTFGQRCPQCYDPDIGVTDSNCVTCFRTGFSGGYHYPIQFFAQIDEAPVTEVAMSHDHHQQRAYTLRCPASPEFKPLDLIIDSKNRRMRVVSVHGTSRLGVRVRQEIQAVLLQPGSIEDAVPLRIDAQHLERAASRNFTNPQNPEAIGHIGDDPLAALLGRHGFK